MSADSRCYFFERFCIKEHHPILRKQKVFLQRGNKLLNYESKKFEVGPLLWNKCMFFYEVEKVGHPTLTYLK